jgi:GNAT superfamily N-acetyltransferase
MIQELALDEPLGRALAAAFAGTPRVDCGIDAAIEGQMGRVFTDDAADPHVLAVRQGPFWYLAGAADHPAAGDLVAVIPPFSLVMPSSPGWTALLERRLGDRLEAVPRVSFRADDLSVDRLAGLVASSAHRDRLQPVDADLAARLATTPDAWFDLDGYGSPADFAARGIGFAVVDGDDVAGAAWSSLTCRAAIEVSVFVDERHRRRGVATAVAARLVLECLGRGLRPNWDAANEESCRLAAKLGFLPAGSYLARYVRP